jgi:hypothetical protein
MEEGFVPKDATNVLSTDESFMPLDYDMHVFKDFALLKIYLWI